MSNLRVIDWEYGSTEYFQVEVEEDGGSADPTTSPVALAFVIGDAEPASGDWHAGIWETTSSGEHIAQCLVGPANGGVPVTAGIVYTVWTKVTGVIEVPIRRVALLNVL